jgi:hypothetical protein
MCSIADSTYCPLLQLLELWLRGWGWVNLYTNALIHTTRLKISTAKIIQLNTKSENHALMKFKKHSHHLTDTYATSVLLRNADTTTKMRLG